VGAQEVALDGGATGFTLPGDDNAETPEPEPWVAFLPALDTTTMAWAERAFYLGEYTKLLFDTNGNAGPTVWLDGRIVGAWAQRPNGEVVHRLFEDLGREAIRSIHAEAAAVGEWLGQDRVFPRFPNPTFRELAAS
jgi:hypothetical protein